MVEQVKVAIIGGGIVGCGVLYGLAKRGWTDAVLLERLELTSGSTWHAAGNITHFGHYAEITRLYVDSLNIYLQAEQESGQSVGFHKTGSLRLATNQMELDAYRSIEGMYEDLGVPYGIASPDEISELHPLINVDGLLGAAHTPGDGHVDASGATHAMAKAARAMGATIKRHCPVLSLRKHDESEWEIDTVDGLIRAEHIVLAASFWTRELALQIGLDLPLYALEHHELITDDIPALKALNFELPTIRDPHAPANTRQEQNSLLCGVYEKNPVFWGTDGIPPEFGQELLVPDIERLEDHLLRVIDRIPAFGEVGIKTVNNGPICYTPDGCPLVGPVTGHEGLWLAAGFPVGIGTGGGSGRFLADWMVDGEPEYDLPIIYPSRYTRPVSRDKSMDLIKNTYAKGYVLPVMKN
jgi:glycine/D-amino acid oxidase-like deaminating enzyme